MLRAALLYLSRQRTLRRWMETSKVVEPLTRRFVAGQTLEEVLTVCQRINAEGIAVTLDHLGENVSTASEAAASRDGALRSLQGIADRKLDSTISIKLTQFGLDLGVPICLANVRPLVEFAREIGSGIEIDMESSEYVDRTLQIVRELHQECGCVRAVIQAYLYRSERDIERLSRERIPVRLVKGAYREPENVAIESKSSVDRNFAMLARKLLQEGVNPAIATHDDRMIAVARGTPAETFEFQMLYGIRRELQRHLVAKGYRLRLYVPYGDAWYPYFMRRLAERPANLFFLVKSLLRK